MDCQQGKSALETAGGTAHSLCQVTVRFGSENVGKQGSGDLGIRIGNEVVALIFQFALDLRKVFHDAVVYDGDFAITDHVRVGIDIARPTMGSPAGVANAQDRVRQWAFVQFFLQRSNLAGFFAPRDLVIGIDRDTSGIIAAVFQAR